MVETMVDHLVERSGCWEQRLVAMLAVYLAEYLVEKTDKTVQM
jgi:hypothetical protein